MSTVLVTGGTGNTGSRVAALLRNQGATVRTASRRPDAVSSEHVLFDWADASTFSAALDGVGHVYLVAPPGAAEPAHVVDGFLDTAVEQGTSRVVLLSSSAVPDAPSGLGALPGLLRAQVPEVAVLRPSWFMQNFTGDHPVAHGIRDRGEIITATGRGRIAFIDAADIAAVAARLLLDEQLPDGDLVLTGPEALSYDDAASIVTQVTGRPVRHTATTTDALAALVHAAGTPRDYARLLANLDDAISRGSEDRTTPTVQDITGRPPRSFREFLTANHLADPARRPG